VYTSEHRVRGAQLAGDHGPGHGDDDDKDDDDDD
jgi:hypothetical protein